MGTNQYCTNKTYGIDVKEIVLFSKYFPRRNIPVQINQGHSRFSILDFIIFQDTFRRPPLVAQAIK